MNVSGSVWDFSSPLGNWLLVSWTESFLMLTFVPSLYLGKVGSSRRPYLQRMAKEGLTVNVRTLSPQWYVVEWGWRRRDVPRAFPSCLIPTLNRASKRPSETLKVISLKGSGSRSELIPAVSSPFLLSTHSFWNPTCGLPAQASLCPFEWLSSSKMATTLRPCGLPLVVAKRDSGVCALLASYSLSSLRLLCSLNKHFLLVRCFSEVAVFLSSTYHCSSTSKAVLFANRLI